MSDDTDVEEFLRELHRQSRMEDMFPFPLIATAVTGDGTAIVVFRADEDAPLVGRMYDYTAFAALFDPRMPADIADAVIVNEIIGPSGPGQIRNYPWERTLTGLEEPVGWLDPPWHPITEIHPVVCD